MPVQRPIIPKVTVAVSRNAVAACVPALILVLGTAASPAEGQEVREIRDVVYATVDGLDLGLDLYMPVGVENPPLVVWVHGGAWQSGTKSPAPMEFVRSGFATASIDFRQSTQARFPAQVHDIKAAIRFLRARAATYGYRTDRVAIAGSSSGGHLVTLVGVTNGHVELEGNVGEHRDQSSAVQAILDYYGATNLTSILAQSTPFGLGVREPALQLLLGGLPDANEETRRLARLASPVFHVDVGDPPIQIFHGDQDPQMPINQSHEIHGAYKRLGLDASLDVVYGSAHGGAAFMSGEQLDRALAFLRRTIGG
jgi:acetyl esterase/lipase